MRFILYFVFFGLLFYIISLYFPETFHTLVSWAQKTYDFLYNLISNLINKINSATSTPSAPAQPDHHEAPKQIFHLFSLLYK